MKSLEVKADYVNHQFHVFQDNRWVDIKLPAQVQAALISRVASDCGQVIKSILKSQMSDVPPGLEELMTH